MRDSGLSIRLRQLPTCSSAWSCVSQNVEAVAAAEDCAARDRRELERRRLAQAAAEDEEVVVLLVGDTELIRAGQADGRVVLLALDA
jgi:hypothetical protein